MWGQEFKKPGDKEWVPAGNLAKTGPILNAKCPDSEGRGHIGRALIE
jgi:hypothetical protein